MPATKMKQKATAFLHKTIPRRNAHLAPASETGIAGRHSYSNPAGILDGLTKILGGGDDEGDHVESINDTTPVEPCTGRSAAFLRARRGFRFKREL